MGRIAVDVVLLPDEAMTNRAIEANAKLVEKYGKEIVLHKENCLPHISLAMGCIDVRDVAAIEKVLTAIAERCALGTLTVVDVRTTTNLSDDSSGRSQPQPDSQDSRGEKVSVFEVEKTRELQVLHEKVMEKVKPYFSSVVTTDMIYGDEEVAETTLLWIKNYPEKASFARFYPHITIGYGEAEEQRFPIEFAASKLALCHLGNHCTCRKVLVSIEL